MFSTNSKRNIKNKELFLCLEYDSRLWLKISPYLLFVSNTLYFLSASLPVSFSPLQPVTVSHLSNGSLWQPYMYLPPIRWHRWACQPISTPCLDWTPPPHPTPTQRAGWGCEIRSILPRGNDNERRERVRRISWMSREWEGVCVCGGGSAWPYV